jgi:phosphoglycolate phosphatase-like HAD superfamily hydrolase
MNLLLFDIDGTLLTTDGAGRLALKMAAADVFGLDEDLSGVTIAGNTDEAIVRSILAKHHLPATERNINRYLGGYLTRLKDNLANNPGMILPGIGDLLSLTDHAAIGRGLLTGNLRRGAELKLAVHRLADQFQFGAFSDDHYDRNLLGPIAKTRAETLYGKTFDPQNIYVIGDTPRDIDCGKTLGARTVAVATGSYSRKELHPYEPDFLFDNLCDLEAVSKALEV